MTESQATTQLLRVLHKQALTPEITRFTLVAADAATPLAAGATTPLAAFDPGAHITLHLPNGMARKYSLCNLWRQHAGEQGNDDGDDAVNDSAAPCYVIAVKREAAGRGGSCCLVDAVQVGDTVPVSLPQNAFTLKKASAYLFIAGGIGITPLLSMIRSLAARRMQGENTPPWRLYYFTRDAEHTAFADLLRGPLSDPTLGGKVLIHHDGGDPARSYDLWPVLEKPGQTHLYCCGPGGLMQGVRDLCGHWNADALHFESFVEGGTTQREDVPFMVRLARNGSQHTVPPGQSILGVLRQQTTLRIPSSCESGSCGSCKTALLEGVADHRDLVLTEDERSRCIMLCVSRATDGELVLDL